jgi:hypothetical protein
MRKSFTISMIAFVFIALGCGGGAGGGQAGSAAGPFSGSVSTAFTAGMSHIDGTYRFTQNNYLLEGCTENQRPRLWLDLHLSDPEADAPP